MRINNVSLFTDSSMATSLNSSAYPLHHVVYLAIQSVITDGAALNGVLSIQGSCDDPNLKPESVTNFTTIAALDQAITADGSFLTDKPDAGFNWLRVIYTRTAGTGTLNVRLNSKGI